MKKTQTLLSMGLAIILFCFTVVFIGCDSQGDLYISVSESVAIEPSRIGEEILQYPGKTEEYMYSVFETYIEIEEYIGSAIDVAVPATIEGLPVKVVGGFSFSHTIKNVTLPEGIIIIKNRAFDNCENLETINIPESVVEIGAYAFDDSNALKSLTIPQSVTKIGDCAFGSRYESWDTLVVRFYKGSAAAEFVGTNSNFKYEIIEHD